MSTKAYFMLQGNFLLIITTGLCMPTKKIPTTVINEGREWKPEIEKEMDEERNVRWVG